MGETAELDSLGEDGILADTGVELGADSALELDGAGLAEESANPLPSSDGALPSLDDPVRSPSEDTELSTESPALGDLGGEIGGDLGDGIDLNDSQNNLDKAIEELSGMSIPQVANAASMAAAPKVENQPTDAEADATDLILDIPVDVSIMLGSAQFSVGQLMSLQPGEVVELNRHLGEPLDIVVNGRSIAKGELTALEGDEGHFGVRVTELNR